MGACRNSEICQKPYPHKQTPKNMNNNLAKHHQNCSKERDVDKFLAIVVRSYFCLVCGSRASKKISENGCLPIRASQVTIQLGQELNLGLWIFRSFPQPASNRQVDNLCVRGEAYSWSVLFAYSLLKRSDALSHRKKQFQLQTKQTKKTPPSNCKQRSSTVSWTLPTVRKKAAYFRDVARSSSNKLIWSGSKSWFSQYWTGSDSASIFLGRGCR